MRLAEREVNRDRVQAVRPALLGERKWEAERDGLCRVRRTEGYPQRFLPLAMKPDLDGSLAILSAQTVQAGLDRG